MNTLPDTLKVWSRTIPERWEDAMISGNGVFGFMSMGGTTEERLIVCHEKCWIEMCDVPREVTDIKPAIQQMRDSLGKMSFHDLMKQFRGTSEDLFRQQYPQLADEEKALLPCNKVHPALHFLVTLPDGGAAANYRRTTVVDTGEIVTTWEDSHGAWERSAFTSRTDDVMPVRIRNTSALPFDCTLSFVSPPAWVPEDVKSVTISHENSELYYHSAYSRSAGKTVPEGYHVFGNVASDGAITANNQGIFVANATEITVLVKVDFLDEATDPIPEVLRSELCQIPADYDLLLERHRAVHSEMINRVRLDLGGGFGNGRCTEEILATADQEGCTPEFLELMHAMGRYAFISSSGSLPPALMGIWSNDWDAPWGGRFTMDSNLNLAVGAGNQGNMHEAMESFFGFIEGMLPDWRENAKVMFGCRGFFSALVQDWRTGKTPWYYYLWSGGPGWLYSYFYDHYLYTQDSEFLINRVIPAYIEMAEFYEDLTGQMPETEDGKYIFYPSVSPENCASSHDGAWGFPNAAMDYAICKQVLTILIRACEEFNLHSNLIPKWTLMLSKVPNYRLLDDGAIAEWDWPDVIPREEHRHASHLYGVYPGAEISGRLTPELARAAKQSIQRRIDAGRSTTSGHGLMHHIYFCARLLERDMFWDFIDTFARTKFMNTSMISNHNPGLDIYNLDSTFSFPGIIMEMLLYSEPGYIHLLPVVLPDRLSKGRIQGILARGGITVQRLEWDLDEGRIDITLTSKSTQMIEVYAPPEFGTDDPKYAFIQNLDLPAGVETSLSIEKR